MSTVGPPPDLTRFADPVTRAKLAHDWLAAVQPEVKRLQDERRAAIEAATDMGRTQAEIAKALGVSGSRIGQLLNDNKRPPQERAFLGKAALTVVVGAKPESDPDKPLTATETVIAFDRLRELADAYGLKASREDVLPPGIFVLNRSNLVVMSGPRLFPMVAQMLDRDTHIRFETDSDGVWVLRDCTSGTVFKSPRDTTGEERDFGYLGRVPRPDGKGNFLCIAGIHATGTQGVVAYLEEALKGMYDEVKTGRFSTIVECKYDTKTKRVTTATLATPLYKWS